MIDKTPPEKYNLYIKSKGGENMIKYVTSGEAVLEMLKKKGFSPVSYTHLTLPTT